MWLPRGPWTACAWCERHRVSLRPSTRQSRTHRLDSCVVKQLIEVIEIDEYAACGLAVGDASLVDEPAEEALGGPLVARVLGDLGEVDVSVVHAPVLPARIAVGDIEVRSSPEKDVLVVPVS